jgi:exopolysaccharide biosynthesis polyprenyl glycosylphosphotransferase
MAGTTFMRQHRIRAVKRLVDVTAASAGLLVLIPILGLVAVFVKSESAGSVLFRQTRTGYRGGHFRIVKFRTMTTDAEEKTHGQWIDSQNPYVTRVGRFLRRTSLDELPELWNVLTGDMSLVGPRPTLPEQVEKYDAFQRRRLEVRPGITGWAQVNGRNSIPWSERIKLDVWYIDHWSLWLDLRILAMTVGRVLTRKGVEDVPPPDGIIGGGT